MAPKYQVRCMLAAIAVLFLFSSQVCGAHGFLQGETEPGHGGRKLLQTCWPGMRLNCPSNTQVECEVGGVGGCSCLAMEACLPEVSGCYIVVDGISTKSCGF